MNILKGMLKNVSGDPISTIIGVCAFVTMLAHGQGYVESAGMVKAAGYACAAMTVVSKIK